MALLMKTPQAVRLVLQPLQRPSGAQHGGIVLADAFPAFLAGYAPVMHQADEVTDRRAGALEPAECILAALAHGCGENCLDAGFGVR